MDSSGSGQNIVMGSCEHDNEPSAAIISTKYSEQVNHYQHLKEDDM
jgi:hypothetical protein